MALNKQQVRHFEEQGYLVLPGLIPRGLISALGRELEALEKKSLAMAQGRQELTWADYFGKEAGPPRGAISFKDVYSPEKESCSLYKIQEAAEFCPSVIDIAKSPALAAVVHQLIGPSVGFNHSKVQFKEARTGPPQYWHQDSWYFHSEDTRILTAVAYVDKATEENGALQVIPRSHKHGILMHNKMGHLKETRVRLEKAVLCGGEPGTTVLFSSLLAHGSARNKSAKGRRGLVIHYSPPGVPWALEADGTAPNFRVLA